MKNSLKKNLLFHLSLLLILFANLAVSESAEFELMVVPTLMDSDMDGWYKIPPNSGPHIHKASEIYQDQMFNLIIFFKGYTADKEKNLHVRYDVQIYDPNGQPTEDRASNLWLIKAQWGILKP